jgi:hypothetical protein
MVLAFRGFSWIVLSARNLARENMSSKEERFTGILRLNHRCANEWRTVSSECRNCLDRSGGDSYSPPQYRPRGSEVMHS